MKIANIMNFARGYNSVEKQFAQTARELELVNETGLDNTFLLQYDAVCCELYQKLFKEKATDKTELGLWYEIVEPLASACDIPYRSDLGLKWDYHIIPGFSMGYTLREREMLIDEAMRKFKEVFGYYPKTVASWVLDTHTVNYLVEHYEISTLAICRDQVNFDAYTLMGGYFDQAYYPSKNNMFTPAQTAEYRINVPVFRLLGPCPIHNYELGKYTTTGNRIPCTIEPLWCHDVCFKALFKAFYDNESLGFSYAQFGQENTLRDDNVIPALKAQLEYLATRKDILTLKMSDTGELFRKTFPDKTPATSVVATENWEGFDVQGAYYDCEKYVANIFRYENSIFIRSLFLFDERIKDHYLTDVCKTSDAIFENMPVVDTQLWFDHGEKESCGLVLDSEAEAFRVERVGASALKVLWKDKYVLFEEEKISCKTDKIRFYIGRDKGKNSTQTEYEYRGNKFFVNPKPTIKVVGNAIEYEYKGNCYFLNVENATVAQLSGELIEFTATGGDHLIFLYPTRCAENKQ